MFPCLPAPVRLAAVAFLALLLPAAARASVDQHGIGPQSDAASLRAARGAAPGPTLHLSFELRDGTKPPQPITVWLGTDYVDIVENGRETLYDFRLRRRLLLDRVAGTFANLSLYGDVAFRRVELVRRLMIADAYHTVTSGAEPPLTLKPFWLESQLGLVIAPPSHPTVKQETLSDGALRFTAGSEQVALFAPQGAPLPPALRRSLARFLRYRLPLHPEVVAAVAADGRLPQRLVLVEATAEERRPVGLVLRRSEVGESDYPLPANLLPRIALSGENADTAVLRPLLPVMFDAVAGRWGNGPRPLADYRRAVDAALQRKQGFAAALLLAEMAEQYGHGAYDCAALPSDAPCHPTAEIDRLLAADPRAAALFKAQSIEAKQPDEAIRIWQGLKRDDVANGYVIDGFIAARESLAVKPDQAMAEFALALRGNPYAGQVYKDLGDHFIHDARTGIAWLCYDLGRALPGERGTGIFAAVDDLEQELAKRYPDFF